MVQIIEEPPSFGAIMGRGLGQLGGAYLGKKLQDMQESKKAKAFQEQFGFDPRTLGPEGIQAFAKKLGEARGGMEILKALKGAGGQTDSGQTGGIDAQSSTGQMSPEQREMVPFVSPQYERYLESQEKINQKKFEADRTFHTKRSSKFLDKVTDLSGGLRERRAAIESSIAAAQSGQMSPLGGDFWADILHAPQLKSASGAQLEAAAKINLMGSLGKVGARPNQFIEQKIDQAFAKAGNTKEAQMAKLLMAKAVMDLDQDYVDTTNRIATEDREKYGYVREDIDGRVEREMKPLAKERMNELAFSLQENIENDIGRSGISQNASKPVMKGTYLTPEMANILAEKLEGAGESKEDVIKLAIELGYKIPSDALLEKMGYVRE